MRFANTRWSDEAPARKGPAIAGHFRAPTVYPRCSWSAISITIGSLAGISVLRDDMRGIPDVDPLGRRRAVRIQAAYTAMHVIPLV